MIVADEDLKATLRVLEYLNASPELRSQISGNDTLKKIFESSRRLAFRSKDEIHALQRERKVIRKTSDLKLLDQTGIRKIKHERMLGSSFPVTYPKEGEMMGTRIELGHNGDDETVSLEGCVHRLSLTADLEPPSLSPQPASVTSIPTEHCQTPFIPAMIPQHLASTPACSSSDSKSGYIGSLNNRKLCHICHASYNRLHHFYDQLCPDCADFNYSKRESSANLRGKIAVVTGGRVKIGFCVALKLLRCGSTVVVTTRFPQDAYQRFKMEADFSRYKDRLRICGVDFRHLTMVHWFCKWLHASFPVIDILINNSAQTVRKPPPFYRHLLDAELKLFRRSDCNEVGGDGVVIYYENSLRMPQSDPSMPMLFDERNDRGGSAVQSSLTVDKVVPLSVAWSQAVLISSDALISSDRNIFGSESKAEQLFPSGLYDIDNQQVDLRTSNSWTLKMGEISTVEMMECHAINAFAPFILISELRSSMQRAGDDSIFFFMNDLTFNECSWCTQHAPTHCI